ncbi:hypothetical protein [Helicobacter sp. 16-1353]|uniref:hypothetical protein n=1 Tax=Helicobacter sp. 16-1353 TaxID=2004996 RepID=UPI0015EE66BF|nr:hypothetical protein [Helicobacter sp. 16-1353]
MLSIWYLIPSFGVKYEFFESYKVLNFWLSFKLWGFMARFHRFMAMMGVDKK